MYSKRAAMRKFGEKLQMLRSRHEMTLRELARALGYTTHSYLSEIESGKKQPTVDLVLALARLFDVSTDQLLKDELSLDLIDVKRKTQK
jgi:transcriptional regulator with XRE-family HTH domain